MNNQISIVSICFNNLEDLKTTIAHIDKQSQPPYEHIIIDGSTTSDIKNYLKETAHPPYRTWISEPDKGISDAWNKGILKAKGDIIHLQNSGDYYYDNQVLETVGATFETHPEITWLHGQYAQYKGDVWVISGKPFDAAQTFKGFRTVGHPTMFVRKELYKKHGLFDLQYKIAMDFDFLMRIANEPFLFIEKPIAVFTPGGLSNKHIKDSMNEMTTIYTKYKGYSLKNRLWALRVIGLHKFTNTRIGKWLFQIKNADKI